MKATNTFSTSYLIVGSGRVARHISYYFQQLGIQFSSWDRSQDPHALGRKVASATHVLLAISDQALQGFFRQHLAGHEKTIVHFSGALAMDGMIAAHPLMTFGESLYDLDFYKKIHFVVTGAAGLDECLPGLTNSFSVLPAADKALYHATCVFGGNFVTLLTAKMLSNFAGLNIPESAAKLYSEKIISNVYEMHEAALTGPLIRKDAETVGKNLQALQGDSVQEIYQAFLKAYWPDYPRK
jgi:predicted short-subunit dehydrogenase-like oxidoreductase (DUF2520 family)